MGEMRDAPEPRKPENDAKIIAGMGRERMALRAKRVTVLLLRVASFMCLSIVLASVAGYVPYALGPVIVLTVTALVGLFLSVVEARNP